MGCSGLLGTLVRTSNFACNKSLDSQFFFFAVHSLTIVVWSLPSLLPVLSQLYHRTRLHETLDCKSILENRSTCSNNVTFA
jgi:hypothetical protein